MSLDFDLSKIPLESRTDWVKRNVTQNRDLFAKPARRR